MPAIHQEKMGNHILVLTLDNPPANSLSKAMKQMFLNILEQIEKEEQIRVIIITGTGTKFCCGDDLKEAMGNATKEGGILHNLQDFSQVVDRFEALEIPTIGAINGWCIGGGLELALCCDIRMAAMGAQFICAGVNVGLSASAYRLPRIIGIGPAKRMLLTGTATDAQQALRFGLVTDIYESEDLLPEAIKLAKVIASKAPLAIRATKQIANTALDLNEEAGAIFQQKIIEQLANSADHREALSAFKEKRSPNFKGE